MLKTLRNFSRYCEWAPLSVALLLPLCFGTLSAQPVAQDSTTRVDLNAYRAELDRVAAAVARLDEHPEEGQVLRDSLPKKWVISDQGTTYEVSAVHLAEDLDEWQKDAQKRSHLDSLKRRIGSMQAEANAFAAEPPSFVNPREKLREILHRREFKRVQDFPWLDRLLERIARWLDRHRGRPRSPGRVSFSPWVGRVMVWTIIVGICLALAFVLWKRITRTQENLELNLSGGEQFHKRSREWVADALAAARRGDYRNAVRCGYWAAVFRLEELGRWTPNRTLTPREYLRMLPADHFQRLPLADLTQRFEITWYGYAVATARDFDKVTEQLEKLGCLAASAAATQKS